jgi:hypothetical protein
MRLAAMALFLVAFLACTPNAHMTKTRLLACVKAQPDEYQVAQEYGVPRRIEILPSGPSYPSLDEPAYLWYYTDEYGVGRTFAFSWDGHLIWQSQLVTPSPRSR